MRAKCFSISQRREQSMMLTMHDNNGNTQDVPKKVSHFQMRITPDIVGQELKLGISGKLTMQLLS